MSLVHLKIKSLLNFIFPFSHHIIVRYYFTKTHSESNECLCHSTPSHPPHPQHAQATSISHSLSLSLSLAVCVCAHVCVYVWRLARVLPGRRQPSSLCLTSPCCFGEILSTKQGIFLFSPCAPLRLGCTRPLSLYPSPLPLPLSHLLSLSLAAQMSGLCVFTHFTSRGPSTPSAPHSHCGKTGPGERDRKKER